MCGGDGVEGGLFEVSLWGGGEDVDLVRGSRGVDDEFQEDGAGDAVASCAQGEGGADGGLCVWRGIDLCGVVDGSISVGGIDGLFRGR